MMVRHKEVAQQVESQAEELGQSAASVAVDILHAEMEEHEATRRQRDALLAAFETLDKAISEYIESSPRPPIEVYRKFHAEWIKHDEIVDAIAAKEEEG
jgi:hypothetical protein